MSEKNGARNKITWDDLVEALMRQVGEIEGSDALPAWIEDQGLVYDDLKKMVATAVELKPESTGDVGTFMFGFVFGWIVHRDLGTS